MKIIQASSSYLFIHATLSWGFVTDRRILRLPCSQNVFRRETNSKKDNHHVCFQVLSTALAAKRKASVLLQTNSSLVESIQRVEQQCGETQFDSNKDATTTTDLPKNINPKRRKSAILQPVGSVDEPNSSLVGATKRATKATTTRSSRAALSSLGTTTKLQVPGSTPPNPTFSANRTPEPAEGATTSKPQRKTRKENKHARLRWEIRFEQLCQYKEQHGHCLVPSQYSENSQLGQWVPSQRAAYKRETMSHDRIQRLEDIGFVWDALQARQEIMFSQLAQYKEHYGDCLVPERFQENPQLARWVNTQRQLYKMKPRTMPEGHIQRLDDIGFVWEPRQASWEFYFDQLVAYKYQHGNCYVPTPFQDNPQLGTWVHSQRKAYQKEPKTLSADRIERLNDVGFVWDPLQVQWETRFTELVQYKQQHGDCLVPRSYQKNPQLGIWVHSQRSCNNSQPKTISEERIQRLGELGFEWDVLRAQWESRFKELLEYKHRYGNCLVPHNFPENPRLAKWVQNQRSLYKQVPKMISDACIRRLDDIGFVWNAKAERELRLRSS